MPSEGSELSPQCSGTSGQGEQVGLRHRAAAHTGCSLRQAFGPDTRKQAISQESCRKAKITFLELSDFYGF